MKNTIKCLCIIGLVFNNLYLGAQIPGKYSSTWLGASTQEIGGNHAPSMQIFGLFVTPDGKSYTAQGWDESGPNGTVWDTDGNNTNINLNVLGEGAISVNNNYVFSESGHTGFQRSNKTGGKNGGSVDCGTHVEGIATTDNEVFISCPDLNLIKVYDANSLGFKRQFTVTQPHRSATAPDGSLWIISGRIPKLEVAFDNANSNCSIYHVDASGGNVIAQITGLQRPRGLAITSDNRLLVAEDGTDQNIKIYSNISSLNGTVAPTPVNFGVVGGVFEGSGSSVGKMGALRFNHPTGVGIDSNGNIYVSEFATYTGGGAVISKYTSSGTRLWVKYGLMFEDGVDFDPTTDGVDVYGKAWHFKMDYTKAQGQEWSVLGYTHGRYKYQYDMRSHWFLDNPGNTWVKNITYNGESHKLLFVTRQTRGDIEVFRFSPSTDGEIVIPCAEIADIHMPYDNSKNWPDGGLFWDDAKEGTWSPNQPAIRSSVWTDGYIWSDLNDDAVPQANEFTQPSGDARFYTISVGNNGDLWLNDLTGNRSNIIRVAFQGFTANGSPKWDYTKRQVYAIPAPFTSGFEHLAYDSEKDIMILAGYQPGVSGDDGAWVGKTIARYDHWSTNAGKWSATWIKDVPGYNFTNNNGKFVYNSSSHMPHGMTLAGDYIFFSYFGGFDPGGIYVSNLSDGNLTGKMLPDFSVYDTDVTYGVRAFKRVNGEYLVSVNHHSRAAVEIFRWCPTGDCTGTVTTVQVTGVSLNTSAATISAGNTQQINATVSPSNATNQSVNWSSGNSSIATVNNSGLVTGIAAGTVVITATTADGGKTATSTITVNAATTGTKVYEAETGVLSGNNIYDCSSCSNGKMVGSNVVGSSITINNVDGGSGGSASLVIKYSADNNRRATLYINGANAGKINWGSGSYGTWRDQSINITLNSGSTNSIKISQDADDNGSYVCADVDKLTVTPTTVTLRDPENPSNPVNGINYSYYTGTWSQLPDFNGLAPVKTGNSTSGFDISPRMQEVNYAFKYTGYISIPADGTYTFYTSSDDGSKLYIGDKEVVNNDGLHAVIEANGQIGLKAGRHAITVTFFQQGGGQSLAVSYDGPGLSKTLVPVSALYIQGSTSVTKVYEAENGVLSGNNIYNSTSCSNGKMVGSNLVGSSITINNVDGGTGGSASLVIKYSADNNRRATLYVNGANAGKINWGSGSYGTWRDQSISITLNSGSTNSIKISQDADDNGSYVCADVDKLTLTTTGSSARYANGGEKNIKPSLKEDYETIVYPNPTNDKVNFSFNTQESGTGDIKFVTMQGETLKTHHFNYSKGENKVSTSVPDQSGNIIIAYLNAGKVKKAFKLIIQR